MAIASISDGTLCVLDSVLVTVDVFISTSGLYLLVNGFCHYFRPDSVRVVPARHVNKRLPGVGVWLPVAGGVRVFFADLSYNAPRCQLDMLVLARTQPDDE